MRIKYTSEEKKAYYDMETSRLMSVLEQAYDDFYNLDKLNGFLKFADKAGNLSFSNQLILWKEKIEFTRLASYGDWKRSGRQVRGGTKSLKLLRGNFKKPKILYVQDKQATTAIAGDSKSDVIYDKEKAALYLGLRTKNGNTLNKSTFSELDIEKTYKSIFDIDIKISVSADMEKIIRNVALTKQDFYNEKNKEKLREKFLKVASKISGIILSAKFGEDVDGLYGKETIKEILEVLNNRKRLFTVWTYAKNLTDRLVEEMKKTFEREAKDTKDIADSINRPEEIKEELSQPIKT